MVRTVWADIPAADLGVCDTHDHLFFAQAPGMPYLLRRLRPTIERELGAAVAAKLFVTDPARGFAADW
jgi:predicted metal-dependent phosphotriesterase family hydrolase